MGIEGHSVNIFGGPPFSREWYEPNAPGGKCCSRCWQPLVEGAKYCTGCGVKILDAWRYGLECVRCKRYVEENWRYCSWCGMEVPRARPGKEDRGISRDGEENAGEADDDGGTTEEEWEAKLEDIRRERELHFERGNAVHPTARLLVGWDETEKSRGKRREPEVEEGKIAKKSRGKAKGHTSPGRAVRQPKARGSGALKLT